MAFIAFLGCDGSGKSAVINGVIERIETDSVKVTTGHWRPTFSSQSSDSSVDASDPHGQKPRGTFSSFAKLGFIWASWWKAWLFGSLAKKSKSGHLIFDRYHVDLLVDPLRYRYGGPMWFARLASRLMPQPDLVCFLDADPEILLQRKQEVPLEDLAISRKKYLELSQSSRIITVVDASQSLADVIDSVIKLIHKVDGK